MHRAKKEEGAGKSSAHSVEGKVSEGAIHKRLYHLGRHLLIASIPAGKNMWKGESAHSSGQGRGAADVEGRDRGGPAEVRGEAREGLTQTFQGRGIEPPEGAERERGPLSHRGEDKETSAEPLVSLKSEGD